MDIRGRGIVIPSSDIALLQYLRMELHSHKENRWRTRQTNASSCSCWRHGSVIKCFSRANLRMLWKLPRPPIRRLRFFSCPTTNKTPLLSILQSEGPWPCGDNQARSKIEWAEGPSDSLDRCEKGKKKKKIPYCCISSSQLWQAQNRKDILFSPCPYFGQLFRPHVGFQTG